MAALEVVKRRLDAVGLGESVLELHSHKTNKRAVLAELEKTLHLGKPVIGEVGDDMKALVALRDRANEYCEAVNAPILDTRFTPCRAIGHFIALGPDAATLPRLPFESMSIWTDSDYFQHRVRVKGLQQIVASIGVPKENAFWGVGRAVVLPTEAENLRLSIEQSLRATKEMRERACRLAARFRTPEPATGAEIEALCRAAARGAEAPNLAGVSVTRTEWGHRGRDLRDLITRGSRLTELHREFDQHLIADAWQENLLPEREVLASTGRKWWRSLSKRYRSAHSRLAGLMKSQPPPDVDWCIGLIDAVLESRRVIEVYLTLEVLGRDLFGTQWQGQKSDWPTLGKTADWIMVVYDEIRTGAVPIGILEFLSQPHAVSGLKDESAALLHALDSQRRQVEAVQRSLQFRVADYDPSTGALGSITELPIRQQETLLDTWASRFSELAGIVSYNVASLELHELGLGFVVQLSDNWPGSGSDLVRAFDASWFAGLIEFAYSERTGLKRFARNSHEHVLEEFRRLDRELLRGNRSKLAHHHWQNLPHLGQGGEVAVIRREIVKKRRNLPIRQLMMSAGRAIQAMKPIFMMSPMSIANFLPPGALDFDLVVFDEASQVKPVDAFGAILRGKQVIVVGDSKQLPPTSFFDSISEETDDYEDSESTTSDLESILGLLIAQNAPERMLRWHYRSRDDSLIAVSNREFYDNRLMLFPSPGATTPMHGLIFNHLPETCYDRGQTRANPEEAKAVAEAVIRHSQEYQGLSLGVAAFSTAQRDAIELQLELLRRKDPSCEGFFAGHSNEPFFVKNLENVQGDERDVIFISIGYGRTKEGYMTMHFGPLNREGGERRLNVLITRARQACVVFSNFTADDLDLNRSNARGVVALRAFLAFARDRRLEQPEPTNGEAESPFEAEVLKALVGLGYVVRPQVGFAGFRIDLGIVDPEHPGCYLLGIECDGATCHSARSARDRDRLRQEVLENLGWRIHRIWSPDWFRDPSGELRRTVEAIEKAKVDWSGRHAAQGQQRVAHHSEVAAIERTPDSRQDGVQVTALLYREFIPQIELDGRELHTLYPSELQDHVHLVVVEEGPVHIDVVVQRITNGAGLQRAGSRIRDAILGGVGSAVERGLVEARDEFLWPVGRVCLTVRDRSNLDPVAKRFDHVPPEEISEALMQVVRSAFSINREEAISRTLDMLGFKRATISIQNRVQRILEQCVSDSRLSLETEILTPGVNM